MNSIQSLPFGLIILLLSLVTAALMAKLLNIESASGRNSAIDGLRGFLAVGVFLHHVTAFYYFFRSEVWERPPSGPYSDLGWTCVSLFFMITAYLFIGKLIDARDSKIDWLQIFISRLLRLGPLYFLTMAGLLISVGLISNWRMEERPITLLWELIRWLAFSIVGEPDINGVRSTSAILAGVTWSLAYEWMFYLALPLIAVVLGIGAPRALTLTCLMVLLVLAFKKPGAFFPAAFLQGALGAIVARSRRVASTLRKPIFGLVILSTAWAALFLEVPPIFWKPWLALAFCAIACGNDAFGLLSNRIAKILGDISYGIYLFHGLFLFWAFNFILGADNTRQLSVLGHWITASLTCVVVVIASASTYYAVERPALRSTRQLTAWIRNQNFYRRHPA